MLVSHLETPDRCGQRKQVTFVRTSRFPSTLQIYQVLPTNLLQIGSQASVSAALATKLFQRWLPSLLAPEPPFQQFCRQHFSHLPTEVVPQPGTSHFSKGAPEPTAQASSSVDKTTSPKYFWLQANSFADKTLPEVAPELPGSKPAREPPFQKFC